MVFYNELCSLKPSLTIQAALVIRNFDYWEIVKWLKIAYNARILTIIRPKIKDSDLRVVISQERKTVLPDGTKFQNLRSFK